LYNIIRRSLIPEKGQQFQKKIKKMKALVIAIGMLLLIAGCKSNSKEENLFHNNWDVSPTEGAFRMDD